MKLIFIRHGDPDYEKDSLTDKGKREAELLAMQIDKLSLDEVFLSPLGRAVKTAQYCLPVLKKETTTYDWLREFPGDFDPNLSESASKAFESELSIDEETGKYRHRILWDVLPSYFGGHPELFDRHGWRESEVVKCSDMITKYDHVVNEFDKLLSDHGYERDGDIYRAVNNNDKTLGFFCHFGITCVLLSHLWNISPFILWQYLAMAPTSVTEVNTEERQRGIAIFRASKIGDITHLNMGNEEPSFSARFCERFENENERH